MSGASVPSKSLTLNDILIQSSANTSPASTSVLLYSHRDRTDNILGTMVSACQSLCGDNDNVDDDVDDDVGPRTPTSTFTQLLSSVSCFVLESIVKAEHHSLRRLLAESAENRRARN